MTRNFCCVLVSFLCLTLMVQAEEIQTKHIFKDMGQQIQYAEDNTVATTDMLTYTCSNGAKFWYSNDKTFGQIAIFMENSNAAVTTTVIEKLKQVVVYYYPSEAKYNEEQIAVSISADGSNWQLATADYSISGMVTIKMPETGDYALKIQRTSGSNFYIHTMEYTTEKCNCFRYVQP